MLLLVVYLCIGLRCDTHLHDFVALRGSQTNMNVALCAAGGSREIIVPIGKVALSIRPVLTLVCCSCCANMKRNGIISNHQRQTEHVHVVLSFQGDLKLFQQEITMCFSLWPGKSCSVMVFIFQNDVIWQGIQCLEIMVQAHPLEDASLKGALGNEVSISVWKS